MTDLSELLVRVQGAEGDSVDLFIAVAVKALPAAYPSGWVHDQELAEWRFLRFEKFLGAEAWESAALALVERCLPGWRPHLNNVGITGHEWQAKLRWWEKRSIAWGRTAALAILAALLKALISQEAGSPSLIVEEGE